MLDKCLVECKIYIASTDRRSFTDQSCVYYLNVLKSLVAKAIKGCIFCKKQ